MSALRITGNQLRAGRALCGLSMNDLADRAHLTTRCLSKWENSSDATPAANYSCLCRAVAVLESEGIRFTTWGVELARPRATTVIASEGVVAS